MRRLLNTFPYIFWLLLGVFVILCLVYMIATPVFEASDELWHFGLVDHFANTWELPVQQPGVDTPWEQEGSQPPLYYVIAAIMVSPLDRGDIDTLRQPNPHVKAGIPGASDNKNLVLHDTPIPPLKGTVLAVYLVRMFSVLLGVVTVCAVYASAELLAGGRVALAAAAITALNPMFLFITASVNNDNLVTALNSLIIFLMLRTLKDGFDTRRSVVLAMCIALSSISKLSGLVLVPAVVLAALWAARRRSDFRGLVHLGVLMAGLWVVLAGWWYVRNLTTYGELFGTNTMVSVAGARVGNFTFQTLLDEFQGFRIAYWGLFGAVNIQAAEVFYVVMDFVVVTALVGLAVRLWRHHLGSEYRAGVLLLLLITATGMVSVIAWTAQTYASQGRLLFPFVAATGPLLASGLVQLLPRPLERIGAAGLAVFALTVAFSTIMPQYATPMPLDSVPAAAGFVGARFGDVTLAGIEVSERLYQPGDSVPVTLYWQVGDRSERDFSLSLGLINADGQAVGKVDTYPGAGRLRTSTWQPGSIYADHYRIPLVPDVSGQFLLRMQAAWWDFSTGVYVEPAAPDGQPLDAVIVDVGGFFDPASQPALDDFNPVDPIDFADSIALMGYQLDGSALNLFWESVNTVTADYTVFVQVLDDENRIVGQGDAPPSLPTGYWRSGQRHVTRHSLYYPERPGAGTYRLIVGWYDPVDFSRLSTAHPENAYLLATITLP